MRAPFLPQLRHRVSALTTFANPFLRMPAPSRSETLRAGHSDGRLLSPRESGEMASRLSRTYW